MKKCKENPSKFERYCVLRIKRRRRGMKCDSLTLKNVLPPPPGVILITLWPSLLERLMKRRKKLSTTSPSLPTWRVGRENDMDRFLDYELKLKAYFQKREATLRKIKNLEFMLLSSLSRFCIATGTSMEMLFSMLEGRECRKEFDSFTQILSLATIMKTVDALREEKNISKRELCRRMDYDRSNFQKLYKVEKSINLVLLFRMIDALDLFPTEFLFKCSEINK